MSTTAGTTESSPGQQWSDLPEDLLALVHLWLASPRDRAHLAAVCKAWRAVAPRLPTLPPVPLLLLSPRCPWRGTKRLCGSDDSWAAHLPHRAENKWFAGSHDGGWVAAVDYGKLVIVNLFSGEEVIAWPIHSGNLDDMEPTNIRKIIFSEAPTSSTCILAAINYGRSGIALCKVAHHDSGWTVEHLNGKSIMDIAFCNGELYALLSPREELIKFKVDIKRGGAPIITSKHPLAVERRHGAETFHARLIELHGKPSMAIHHQWVPNRECFFKVFTLVETDGYDEVYMYKWEEVTSFGDHALFLGSNWSKAVHVMADGHHGLMRNHIYYSITNVTNEFPDDTVYSVTINDGKRMYCKKDKSVGDGVERTGYYLMDYGYYSSMWIYPPCL